MAKHKQQQESVTGRRHYCFGRWRFPEILFATWQMDASTRNRGRGLDFRPAVPFLLVDKIQYLSQTLSCYVREVRDGCWPIGDNCPYRTPEALGTTLLVCLPLARNTFVVSVSSRAGMSEQLQSDAKAGSLSTGQMTVFEEIRRLFGIRQMACGVSLVGSPIWISQRAS